MIDKVKVLVTNDKERDEVCNLFDNLDLAQAWWTKDFNYPYVICNWVGEYYSNYTTDDSGLNDVKILTIQQLRDVVVLNRNSVEDATHVRTMDNKLYFVNSDNTRSYYMMDNEWTLTKWDERQLRSMLVPLSSKLITNEQALEALQKGENIEYSVCGSEWDTALNVNIGVFLNPEKFSDFKFRIKPKTIKIGDVEIKQPKDVVVDPITGSVCLVYDDLKDANSIKDILKGLLK